MTYSVKVILDGNTHEISVKEGETILEAAIDANLDPPYACRA
ncbi:MAG: 2Fe-2S iron-sulfur cluster binding domain-containing protein [Saprospirales bacterium]|nr:2Fe-2S iron-sulfur cluster binding domain-containing protein [Saprospirales bacterium]